MGYHFKELGIEYKSNGNTKNGFKLGYKVIGLIL